MTSRSERRKLARSESILRPLGVTSDPSPSDPIPPEDTPAVLDAALTTTLPAEGPGGEEGGGGGGGGGGGEVAPPSPDVAPRRRGRRPSVAPDPALAAKEAAAAAAQERTCQVAARQVWRSVFSLWGRLSHRTDCALSPAEADEMGAAWGPILALHADKLGAALVYMAPIALTIELVERRLPLSPEEASSGGGQTTLPFAQEPL